MKRSGLLALAGLAAGLVTLTGCSVGAYPVDFYQEMHYSPAVRRQEAPTMSAPAGAVAFRSSGGPTTQLVAQSPYDFMSVEALTAITENPLGDSQAVRDLGAALFARNCVVCHGAQGDGQGSAIIVAGFTAAGAKPPANLTAAQTRDRTDGALFAIITHGFGTVPVPADAKNPAAWAELTNMPRFQKLLSPEERWALVRHIRDLQGQ